MITLFIPGLRLSPPQYAHQKNVEHFGDLIVQLEEQSWTHITQVVWLFVISISIGNPVHPYTSTGLLAFKEFSKAWLHPGKV